jgi:hypothetical protein
MLMANSHFQIRSISYSPVANAMTIKKRKAILTVDPTLGFAQSPAIWTNHVGFVAVLEEHFEKTCSEATKPVLTEHIENSLTAQSAVH